MIALITIFTLLAIPTFLFAVSPQFRQVIHGFSIEWKDDHIELFSVIDGSSSASKDKEAQSPFYAPTYLPEGFELTDIQYNFASTHLRYEKVISLISITIYSSSAGLSMDNEHTQYYFDYEVHDYPAIVAINERNINVLWSDYNGCFAFGLLWSWRKFSVLPRALPSRKSYSNEWGFMEIWLKTRKQ